MAYGMFGFGVGRVLGSGRMYGLEALLYGILSISLLVCGLAENTKCNFWNSDLVSCLMMFCCTVVCGDLARFRGCEGLEYAVNPPRVRILVVY